MRLKPKGERLHFRETTDLDDIWVSVHRDASWLEKEKRVPAEISNKHLHPLWICHLCATMPVVLVSFPTKANSIQDVRLLSKKVVPCSQD